MLEEEHVWRIWVCVVSRDAATGHMTNGCAGSILFAALAILVAAFLFIRSERKKAAVGRR